MPVVSELYRYPVKGLTAQSCASLTVQPDGRIAGDRVLALRFAMAAKPEDRDGFAYWPKSKGLALMDFPSLAQVRLEYDERDRRVRLFHGTRTLVDARLGGAEHAADDAAARAEIAAAVTEFVRATPEGRRLDGPGRLPLVLVGDGVTSRFQDRPLGYVSLHGDGSVNAVAEASNAVVDGRRFRSNIVVSGLAPWAELEWEGEVRIGEMTFRAQGPIVRCLATHANPDTGERDLPVLTTLARGIGQRSPTLGRLLLPADVGEGATAGAVVGAGGTIRVGDEVVVA